MNPCRSRHSMWIVAVILLVGCADPSGDPIAPGSPQLSSTYGAVILECPTNNARSVRGTVGVTGGTISFDGHSVRIPLQAVLRPTEIELALPASNYMEVEIRAVGHEDFEFLRPVSITISYDRCTRSNIDRRPLTAWFIDPATKTLLEHMGGTDDKEARTVTFSTGHLSGYAIAE